MTTTAQGIGKSRAISLFSAVALLCERRCSAQLPFLARHWHRRTEIVMQKADRKNIWIGNQRASNHFHPRHLRHTWHSFIWSLFTPAVTVKCSAVRSNVHSCLKYGNICLGHVHRSCRLVSTDGGQLTHTPCFGCNWRHLPSVKPKNDVSTFETGRVGASFDMYHVYTGLATTGVLDKWNLKSSTNNKFCHLNNAFGGSCHEFVQ